jgi:SAM-dependent methyltransferase
MTNLDFWTTLGAVSYALGQWDDRSAEIDGAVIGPNRGWFTGRRVVDLGCGAGEVTQRMSEAGADVTGVEACPVLARMAAARLGACRTFLGSWCAYVPDSAVDLVTFWSSTFGLRSSGEALDRVRGWLAPGGRVVIDVVDADRLLGRFEPTSELRLGRLSLVERRTLDASKTIVSVSWELESGAPLGGYELRLFDRSSLVAELSRMGFAEACLLVPYDEDRLVATATV